MSKRAECSRELWLAVQQIILAVFHTGIEYISVNNSGAVQSVMFTQNSSLEPTTLEADCLSIGIPVPNAVTASSVLCAQKRVSSESE